MVTQKFPIDSDWFTERLKQKGYSLRRFSGALGMDPSAVSRMFNGKRNMSAEEQDRVAALLGLTLLEISAHRGSSVGGFEEMGQSGYYASTGDTKRPPVDSEGDRGIRRHPIIGCMKGTMRIPDDLDLTAPVDPEWAKVYDDR